MEAHPPAPTGILDETAALHDRGERSTGKEAVGVPVVGDGIAVDLTALRLKRDPAERVLGTPTVAKAGTLLMPVTAPRELRCGTLDRLSMDT